ncbi:DUF4389 domain-containing protein [Micromonospora matsumotoense]|uniref:DUF4389 domain-containing protein n=1 Tax=Micromonospora matsumotoense TaxID=121616 RepID=UPI00343A97D4
MNRFPVQVQALRTDSLSRWLWLVKWLLLIPHYLVLAVLWIAFVVTTVVAYVAVLATGRYPPAIFAFNIGVLRWTWRVNYYGYQVLGTDRYPPFTLADVVDYPARLHVDAPTRQPRWRPLVAWLFAIPHLALIGALSGATWQIQSDDTAASIPLGVVGLGLLIAGIGLLFTGRYPRGLYDLLLGVARWNLRVTAYLALLTTRYPPFRLDQGDREPDDGPTGPDSPAGSSIQPQADDGPRLDTEAPPQGPAAQGSAAAPVVALVAGVAMLLLGAGTGAAGAALIGLGDSRDATGYVTSPRLQVSSPTAAITVERVSLHLGDLWARNLSSIGGVRVTATNAAGTPLFLGIAEQTAVDEWLTGTAHDGLVNLTRTGSRYERTSGTVRSVPAPTGQSFWLATATGTASTVLNWQATDGDFAVVLTNADGAPAVSATTVTVATQVPDPTPLAIGLLGGATALVVLGFWLVYLGATRIGRHHLPNPPGGSPTSPPVPTPVPALV